jgi:hypothetical protein
MRATVKFDVDIKRVPETMRCLVLEEAYLLNATIERLEGITTETLSQGIEEVLSRLHECMAQLQQYKDMLLDFERAKLDNLLPPVSPESNVMENMLQIKETTESMKKFDNFLDQVRQGEVCGDGKEEDDDSQEG